MAITAAGKRRRRSVEELAGLARAYEASGQTQREFAARSGLSLASLGRCLRRARSSNGLGVSDDILGTRFVPVEVLAGAALTLVHASGARIEVGAGFDGETLRRLLEVLTA